MSADDRCPVCRAALWFPRAETIGQRSCPRCGAELWALVGSGATYFPRRPGEKAHRFLARLLASLDGTSVERTEAALKTADAFDLVELVMEVEEAMRKTIR